MQTRSCVDKCDLEEAREVDTIEGEQLAKSWSCPFYEVCLSSHFQTRFPSSDIFRLSVDQTDISGQSTTLSTLYLAGLHSY
jgi:hypothetical protein